MGGKRYLPDYFGENDLSALLSLCTDLSFRKFIAKMNVEAKCWQKMRTEHKVKTIDDLNLKSVASPAGQRIASGRKTIEVRKCVAW
ncbi:hypothetical protein D083_0295 [Dickeya solani RNS 08.23.3.1.A]|nr:hypothetical protein D083_0295 [Dickeya solani RNS 08.23.3.1.A]